MYMLMDASAFSLAGDLARTLALALVHSLWQATLIAWVVAIILKNLTAVHATARYRHAMVGMIAVPLCFFVQWLVLFLHAESSLATSPAGSATLPGIFSAALAPSHGAATIRAADADHDIWGLIVATVLALWAILALYRGYLAVRQLRLAHQLTQHAQPADDARLLQIAGDVLKQLNLDRPVRVMQAVAVDSPCVVGWWQPVLLVPPTLVGHATTEHLRIVIAHELAHLRRADYLVNAVQLFVESFFFFNPALQWLSRQVRIEREAACDDLAVRALAPNPAGPDHHHDQRARAARALIDVVDRLWTNLYPPPPPPPSHHTTHSSPTPHGPHISSAGELTHRVADAAAGQTASQADAPTVPSTSPAPPALTSLAGFAQRTAQIDQGGELFSRVSRLVAPQRKPALRWPTHAIPMAILALFILYAPSAFVRQHHFSGSPKPSEPGAVTIPAWPEALNTPPTSTHPPSPSPPTASDSSHAEGHASTCISGNIRLRDDQGRPIAFAALRAWQTQREPRARIRQQYLLTDSDGQASFEYMPNLPVEFEARVAGYQFDRHVFGLPTDAPGTNANANTNASAAVAADTVTDAASGAGAMPPLQWSLQPARATRGIVRSASTGEPIRDAVVLLVQRRGFYDEKFDPRHASVELARTSYDGRFRLPSLRDQADYTLFIKANGYGGKIVGGVFAGSDDLVLNLDPPRQLVGRISAPPTGLRPDRLTYRHHTEFSPRAFTDSVPIDWGTPPQESSVALGAASGAASGVVSGVASGQGRFIIPDILPGRLEIDISGQPLHRFTIAEGTANLVLDLSATASE